MFFSEFFDGVFDLDFGVHGFVRAVGEGPDLIRFIVYFCFWIVVDDCPIRGGDDASFHSELVAQFENVSGSVYVDSDVPLNIVGVRCRVMNHVLAIFELLLFSFPAHISFDFYLTKVEDLKSNKRIRSLPRIAFRKVSGNSKSDSISSRFGNEGPRDCSNNCSLSLSSDFRMTPRML